MRNQSLMRLCGTCPRLGGGDFELPIGRDLSIGYHGHTEASIRFSMVERMGPRVLAPEAAVTLAHKDEKSRRAR